MRTITGLASVAATAILMAGCGSDEQQAVGADLPRQTTQPASQPTSASAE